MYVRDSPEIQTGEEGQHTQEKSRLVSKVHLRRVTADNFRGPPTCHHGPVLYLVDGPSLPNFELWTHF
jgi:hypothetical protein